MSVFQEQLRPRLIKWGKPHQTSSLVIDSGIVAAWSVWFPSLDESGSELLHKDDHVHCKSNVKRQWKTKIAMKSFSI